MGNRTGPPPKPTALKVLQGNPGKRALPKNEPKPTAKVPACPMWLHPVAKKEWRRIVPELKRLGLLTCVDGAALEAYCQSYARWVEAEQLMLERGTTVFKTPSGYLQQLPQVSIAQKYAALCKAFLTEFGLTPASRTRIQTPNSGGGANDLLSFLRNG